MGWQHISLELTVKVFKKCCLSSALGETDNDMLWNGSEDVGMLGGSVRKMNTLIVKMETVTLIGKGR
jgi:hypothetical protein